MPFFVDAQTQNRGYSRRDVPRKETLVDRFIKRPFLKWQRRKAIATLAQLDDRILADIGLCRGEIPDVVDHLIASDVRPALLDPASGEMKRRPRGFGG